MNKLILVGIVVALTACGEKIQDAPQPGDKITLPSIEWRVRDRMELEAVYRNSGQHIGERDRLHGFAGYDGDQAVIYTLPPRRVDDGVACTIGHEVMHIALGQYHN